MNHFGKIAQQLSAHGLDAMLVTSAPGEFYAAGFHGEGMAVVTPAQTGTTPTPGISRLPASW